MLKHIVLFVFLIAFIPPVFPQGLFNQAGKESDTANSRLTFNGYSRGVAVGLNKQTDYSAVYGEFCLQSKLSSGNTFVFSDLRFRSGFEFNKNYSAVELKEAYAGFKSNKINFVLGNQIVSWGRTDGFNPTNNIAPNNYFFLSENPDDQKMANFMLRSYYRITPQINWEIIVIPLFKPSVYRYELFDMGQNVQFDQPILPEQNFSNSSLASRINFDFPAFGFSLSWFSGYDPFYGYDIQNIDFSTGQAVITNAAAYYKKNSIGFDFEWPLGTYILKGEIAANSTMEYENKMYIPNPDISYVTGIEHDFGGIHTLLQYVGKYTHNFSSLWEPVPGNVSDPLVQMQYAQNLINFESTAFNRKIFHQQEKMNHALALSLSRSFAYEAFNAEITGYYDFTSEEYIVRPKISWKEGNGLELHIGGSWMQGPEESVFKSAGQILNGGFIAVKASF